MEIAGYRDALDMIHHHHTEISFNENTILRMHETIMAIDANGRRSVRFRPVPAQDTQDAMEQLVLAYMDARANSNVNQLLLIPCVILDFLCIHPFQDGNGRVSRLMSLLLMYKNEYDICKYVSFEEQINNSKDRYYQSLYESSQGWHENHNSYIPFMENFLVTLYKCYKELDRNVSSHILLKYAKNESESYAHPEYDRTF